MIYSSKKGTIIIIAFLMLLLIPIKTLIVGEVDKSFNLAVIGAYFFVLLTAFTIQYRIKNNVLIISSFFVPMYKIKIEEIHTIASVTSFISAPAASIYRLKISYGSKKSYVLISPAKEKQFIQHLININPQINII